MGSALRMLGLACTWETQALCLEGGVAATISSVQRSAKPWLPWSCDSGAVSSEKTRGPKSPGKHWPLKADGKRAKKREWGEKEQGEEGERRRGERGKMRGEERRGGKDEGTERSGREGSSPGGLEQ